MGRATPISIVLSRGKLRGIDIFQNQVAASFSLRYLACYAQRVRSEQAAVDAGFERCLIKSPH